MNFHVKTRRIKNAVVLDLSGRLTIGEAVKLLRDMINSCMGNGDRKFVLNLEDVSHIDSSGVGELVWAHVSVRNRGGNIVLVNLTSKVRDLLQITKLLTVFDTYDSESRAIGALTGWPGL